MDEIEHSLKRALIATRAIDPNKTPEAERRLYEYQIHVGSAAMYYTYERVDHGNI